MIGSLIRRAAHSGRHARLSILIFHRVLSRPDPLFPYEVDAARFEDICAWTREWFDVVPLSEALSGLRMGELRRPSLSITFDDGYADNLTCATPILEKHGLKATFFVATGFLDGGTMWNDTLIDVVRACGLDRLPLDGLHPTISSVPLDSLAQRRGAIQLLVGHAKYLPVDRRQAFVDDVARRAEVIPPSDQMLTSDQLRSLRARGQDIGAHTVSHPILRTLTRDDARREIEDSKRKLEGVLGEPVRLFAYPNGKPGEDYVEESVELAREAGFDAAVSTRWGVSTKLTDPFQLRRFTPWDRQRWRFGLRLWQNLLLGERD